MTDAVDRTTNLKLPLPDFNKSPWQELYYEFVRSVDALISRYFTINNYEGVWLNDTAYAVGDRVIDGDLATLHECLVAHTSAAAPTLFAADRTANPSFWGTVPFNDNLTQFDTSDALKFIRVNAAGTALEYTTIAGGGDLLAANNLSDVADAATALANLGGGAGDLLAANNLSDVASAATARTNLGLAIGTDVQAWSSVLDATTASYTTAEETKLAGIETSADVTDTANVTAAGALMDSEVDADIKTLALPANTTISAFGASLVDDAAASNARTTLGLVIGTDVQAQHARLADIAGATYAQGNLLYFNGTNLVVLAPGTDGDFLKTQGAGANPVWETIPGGGDLLAANNLSDVVSASTSRTNLGLAIGSDVQAHDAGLDAIAALAVTDSNFIVGNGSAWVAESGATVRTSLGLGSLATLSTINNSNWSGTDLAITNGGTGASSAAAAIAALGGLPVAGGTMTGELVFADQLATRPFIKDYAVESTAPTISAGTLTLDLENGNDFNVSWNANITTLTISNWPASGRFGKFTLRLAMDGTTRTIAWPAAFNWPSGTEPTDPGVNEDIEIVAWSRDGGTTVQAAEVGKAFA